MDATERLILKAAKSQGIKYRGEDHDDGLSQPEAAALGRIVTQMFKLQLQLDRRGGAIEDPNMKRKAAAAAFDILKALNRYKNTVITG